MNKESITEYIISKWNTSDPPELCALEQKTWAPWLRKSQKNFETIALKYPDFQRKITTSQGELVAMISTNRINWDGNIDTLPTWDSIAGGSVESGDFSPTYKPSGNTISIMSSSVTPEMQGSGLATIMLREIINMAEEIEVDHLIASFRPFGFGIHKLKSGNEPMNFDNYCQLTTTDGLPLDPWLRVATRLGMIPLRVDDEAIKVEVSKNEFEVFKFSFNKEGWVETKDNKWECGEVGTWTIIGDYATFRESNLWSEIPINRHPNR